MPILWHAMTKGLSLKSITGVALFVSMLCRLPEIRCRKCNSLLPPRRSLLVLRLQNMVGLFSFVPVVG